MQDAILPLGKEKFQNFVVGFGLFPWNQKTKGIKQWRRGMLK